MLLKKTLAKALTGVALASSLYGFPVKDTKAEPLLVNAPLYFTSWSQHSNVNFTPNDSSNSNLYKQKQQKHYNWIKPDKGSKWQCAYELTYNRNTPDGFNIYVDEDGDNKPDYKFGYYMDRYYASSNSFTYVFYRKGSSWPVGDVYYSWKKALNVCAPMAIRKYFYERDDTWDDPSTFKEMKTHFDYNYIRATFVQ